MSEESRCEKCAVLSELYNQVPYSHRNYWLMTELFVMIHGGDECMYSRRGI